VLQKYVIPAPTRALIHRLSEVGYLYTRVEFFVREREATTGVGMIEQSLCHHLQTQLTEYYRLIAVLESQMAPEHTQNELVASSDTKDSQRSAEEETGLTLRRLDVWINEWRLRMRMMSVCVEGARGTSPLSQVYDSPKFPFLDAHGGALVNLIHGYTDNGDPFIRKFTDQLLEEVCPGLGLFCTSFS
jgi:gamma-tubulin complex component 3